MSLFHFERIFNLRLSLLLTGVLFIGVTQAGEYQDPLDQPSINMQVSQKSLLLDGAMAGSRLVAVGERGHIIYSDDQGEKWQQADVATRSHLNAVQFFNEKLGWAVGEDGIILNTQDGGLSWQHQADGRDAQQKGPLLDLYFKNAKEGFAVGVFNKIFHTLDGGHSWQPWQDNIDNEDEWHLFAMSAVDQHLYIASEMGLVFRSLDGGKKFEQVQTDHDGSFHGVLARKGLSGQDELVLFGVGGVVYTSLNSGETWLQLDTATEDGLSGGVWLDDGSALIVGANGVMVKLDRSLTAVSTEHTRSAEPLSGVFSRSASPHIALGLGGLHKLPKL
jgi:Uncharacterized protein related to plant photosystem II stability/assembly factor